MKVAMFYNASPGTAGEYFQRALVGLGHTVDHVNLGDADRCAREYALYFRVDHGDYSQQVPADLHPCIFYAIDAHLARSWKRIREQASRYDAVFCTQRRAAQQLPRAFWVPIGCDAELHGRRQAATRYDLAFVGNDGGVPRKFYLQELNERYANSFIGKAPYTQMAELYSQAKIGFHYIECTSPLKDHVSMRVYEILASGAMVMANALEPGAFEAVGLRDRQELVVYHSPQELLELIDYYLVHDAQRQQIAEAGRRCALERHTYRHRVEQILDILNKERII